MLGAADFNNDGKLSRSELKRLLKNIGAAESMSDADLQAIFDEYGRFDEELAEKLIDISYVQKLILGPT
jgi:Ca2+-binding EF-hand superfamily protein